MPTSASSPALLSTCGSWKRCRPALCRSELRRELAAAAFEMTARYDRAIADYMAGLCRSVPRSDGGVSRKTVARVCPQAGTAVRREPAPARGLLRRGQSSAGSLAAAEQLHGKELSYNNLLDLDAALNLVREFTVPAAVVLKHNNPCGAGIGETLKQAFDKA